MREPLRAHDTTLLCETAQHLLAERVAKYPAIVAAGRMTQAAAHHGIRTMRAVATRWAMIPLRDLAKPRERATWIATEREMRDTLAAASAHTAQRAAADPGDAARAKYAEAVAALLWHAEKALTEQAALRRPDAKAA